MAAGCYRAQSGRLAGPVGEGLSSDSEGDIPARSRGLTRRAAQPSTGGDADQGRGLVVVDDQANQASVPARSACERRPRRPGPPGLVLGARAQAGLVSAYRASAASCADGVPLLGSDEGLRDP